VQPTSRSLNFKVAGRFGKV